MLVRPDLPQSLPSFLAHHLGQEIEIGLLKPGERIAEEAVAQRFGVSRATVRDAFRQLAREELIEHRPRRGIIVCSMSVEDLRAALELRAGLYATIIRLFTRCATDEEIVELAKLTRQIAQFAADPTTTPETFTAATQAHSLYVREHCGNPRLEALFARMTRQSYRSYALLAHQTPAGRRSTAHNATKLLQTVRVRDAEEAAARAWQLVEANHVRMIATFTRQGVVHATASGGARQREEAWPSTKSKTMKTHPTDIGTGRRRPAPKSGSRKSA